MGHMKYLTASPQIPLLQNLFRNENEGSSINIVFKEQFFLSFFNQASLVDSTLSLLEGTMVHVDHLWFGNSKYFNEENEETMDCGCDSTDFHEVSYSIPKRMTRFCC